VHLVSMVLRKMLLVVFVKLATIDKERHVACCASNVIAGGMAHFPATISTTPSEEKESLGRRSVSALLLLLLLCNLITALYSPYYHI
jgi:hypothetical protein